MSWPTTGGWPLPSFDQVSRTPVQELLASAPRTAADYPAITHGRSAQEYSEAYNHNSHLTDEVGVFRSDCQGCQRHFREAFGPDIAVLLLALTVTEPGDYRTICNTWLDALDQAEARVEPTEPEAP